MKVTRSNEACLLTTRKTSTKPIHLPAAGSSSTTSRPRRNTTPLPPPRRSTSPRQQQPPQETLQQQQQQQQLWFRYRRQRVARVCLRLQSCTPRALLSWTTLVVVDPTQLSGVIPRARSQPQCPQPRTVVSQTTRRTGGVLAKRLKGDYPSAGRAKAWQGERRYLPLMSKPWAVRQSWSRDNNLPAFVTVL